MCLTNDKRLIVYQNARKYNPDRSGQAQFKKSLPNFLYVKLIRENAGFNVFKKTPENNME